MIEQKILEYLIADGKKRALPKKVFGWVWERQAKEIAAIVEEIKAGK